MENLREKQGEEYLEEAELTLVAAEGILKQAKETGKGLWAQAVKCCYDSMEQAVSAALAKKELLIPKEHPAKVALLKVLNNPSVYGGQSLQEGFGGVLE